MADVSGCTDAVRAQPVGGIESQPCPETARKWVLTVAILASALGFIDGSVVTIAVPAIRDGLGASFTEIQWIMNGYLLFLAALILPAGALGDRLGQRDVILAGIAAFTLASVWCGFAQSPGGLIAARMAKGVAAAAMIPGSLALIAKNFPEKERGAAIGLWSGAAAITTALGPVVGGLILGAGGDSAWRWIFFLNVPLGVVAIGLALFRIPRDPGRPGASIDIPGGLLAAMALGGIAYGLTSLTEGDGAGLILPALLIAAAASAAFLLVEARSADPMMPPALFRSKSFSGANAMTFFLYLALGGMLFFAPVTLIEMHGLAEGAVGFLFVPFTLVLAVISRATGRWADKTGYRTPLTAGALIAAAAFALIGLFVRDGAYLFGVLPGMALLGLGMGIAIPPLGAAVMAAVPEDRVGVASGINNAVSRVSQLIAIAGLGFIVSASFRSQLPGEASDIAFGERPAAGISADAYNAALGAGFITLTIACVALAGLSAVIAFLTQDAKPESE